MTFSGVFILAFLHIHVSISDSYFNHEGQLNNVINIPEVHYEDTLPIYNSGKVADIVREDKLSNSRIRVNDNSKKPKQNIKDNIRHNSYGVSNENFRRTHEKSMDDLHQRFEETGTQFHKINTKSSMSKIDKGLRNTLLNERKMKWNWIKPKRSEVKGKNQLGMFPKPSKPITNKLSYGRFGTYSLTGNTLGRVNEKDNLIKNIPLKWQVMNRISPLKTPKMQKTLGHNTHSETNEHGGDIDDKARTTDDIGREVKTHVNKRTQRGKRSALNILNMREIGTSSIPEVQKHRRTLSSRFYETLSSLVRLKMTHDNNLSEYPSNPRILLKSHLLEFLNTYGKRRFNSWGGKRDTINIYQYPTDNWDGKQNVKGQKAFQDSSDLIDQLFQTGDSVNDPVSLFDIRILNGQKMNKRGRQRRVFHPWAGK